MWQKWFNQAGQIDKLTRQLEFQEHKCAEIERMLEREEQRNALLESAIKTEQKAHNQALRRYADQISKQVGLPQHFVSDTTPKAEPKPEEPDMEMVRWEALRIREADIDSGASDVPPLQFYINKLIENPSDIIIG